MDSSFAERKELQEIEDVIVFYQSLRYGRLPKLSLRDARTMLRVNARPPAYSYLMNADTTKKAHFAEASVLPGDGYPIVRFVAEEYECCNLYAGSYAPGDSLYAVYGAKPFANIYFQKDYLADHPEDDRLDWLGTSIHEMAHLTEHYVRPDSLPEMFEFIFKFETDSLWRTLIHLENEYLLRAIQQQEMGHSVAAAQAMADYQAVHGQRTARYGTVLLKQEAYYEFIEGYARYLEYRAKQNAAKFFGDTTDLYQIDNEPFMYDTKIGNAYFYATGFNKLRWLIGRDDFSFVASIEGRSGRTLDDYLII